MRKLDNRIELYQTFKNKATVIGKKYSANIDRLDKFSHCKKEHKHEYYTSRHYIYGTYIVHCWKEFMKLKYGSLTPSEKKELSQRKAPSGSTASEFSVGDSKSIAS